MLSRQKLSKFEARSYLLFYFAWKVATFGNTSSGHHGEELVEVDSAALVLVHLVYDAVHLLPDEEETLIHNFIL